MDPSLIFVAVMALFVCYQLYATLGKRDGHEPEERDRSQPPRPVEPASSDTQSGQDTSLADQPAPKQQPAWAAPILDALPQFDADEFTAGAKAAYEMIVGAFAAGELQPVKPYVEPSVYRAFEAAVKTRTQAGQRSDLTFVGISKTRILSADVTDSRVRVMVEFESDQTRIVRDSDDTIIEGDPNRIDLVRDCWTFSRSLKSRDPNWLLVATGGSAPVSEAG
ncbi:MAG: Tim44/TimA family putative adaptor protein [Parvularculaceae bacterium]